MRPNKTKEGDTLAITKTWTVKDDLNRVLNYIKNPDKTTELVMVSIPRTQSHSVHYRNPPNPLIRAIYTLSVVRCICKILNSTNIANWRCFLHMTEKYHTSKFVWYFILLT